MTTEAQFADIAFKKLLSYEDFQTRMMGYLQEYVRENMFRVFSDDGSFATKATFAGFANDTIRVSPPGSRMGTDGAGHILELGFLGIDTEFSGRIKDFLFENTVATVYYVSYQYTPIPRGIVINPRNGMPQYAYNIEGIGRRNEPNAVTDNGNGTITFDINDVCDGAGHSYAGRRALVFLKTPVKDAIMESIALETRTITWNGVNNRITTAGALGQSVISTDPNQYEVILLGPTVSKTDTAGLSGHWFMGAITGTGAGTTPGAGNNTNQNLIDTSLSTFINYDGGPSWADGTINGPTTIHLQLDKIISDLTSTTGQRGAGKLTAPAFANWADGTSNPATRLDQAIGRIITDLALVSGAGGASRIGIGALPDWFDGFTNPADTLFNRLFLMISHLADDGTTFGNGGGDKIGVASRNGWLSGLTNPAESVFQALNSIVEDLSEFGSTFSGSRSIGAENSTATLAGGLVIGGGSGGVRGFLENLITALGGSAGATRIGATASGNLSGTTVATQITELDSEKGGLALANVWSGASSENDFRRNILIGSDLNSSASDREITRIEFDINLTSDTRTRIMDFGLLGGSTHRTILYVRAGDGGVDFEIARNARWDATNLEWIKEKGAVSHLFRVRANGGFEHWRHQGVTASTVWDDVYGVGSGGWEFRNLDVINDVSGTTINSTRWRVHNGKIQFTDSRNANDDNATNPNNTFAVRPNTLYAGNMLKGWAHVHPVTTTPTFDWGFNMTGTYSGNNLVMTFPTAPASTFYQAWAGLFDGSAIGTAGWLTSHTFASNGVTISAWRIAAGAVVQVNLNGSNGDWGLMACARQDSTT